MLSRKEAKDKVLREVRTLAKLESPYIVRYFYSWFEKHSYDWQKLIDKEKLFKQNNNDFNDEMSATQFSFSNTNTDSLMTTRTTTKTNSKKKKNDFENTSSSSYIVFEKSETDDDNDEIEFKYDDDDNTDFEIENEDFDDDVSVKSIKKDDKLAYYIYIQMELCQRETLRHWLDKFKNENRGRLQIIIIFQQILNAISYIHSQDLIHRDLKVILLTILKKKILICFLSLLKPSNIFLSLDGKTIKIGDFGLVVSVEQQIDDEEDNTNNNEIKKKLRKSNDGTYLYMSPEQVIFSNDCSNDLEILILNIF
jgi:serine/threonine protein kinase